MSRPARSFAVLLLLCLGACGAEPLEPLPHGLEIRPLGGSPAGEALATFDALRAGRWEGRVEKSWTEIREGGAPQTGRAVLALRVERREEAEGWSTHLVIAVQEAEGLGARYVAAFDGLDVTVRHDASGRPDPTTLRYAERSPPAAASFLSGFWLAGVTGAAPWFPPEAVRVGEAWARDRLGGEAALQAALAVGRSRPELQGGGRLEAVLDEGKTIEVLLDTLVDVRTATPSEALTFGILDRGTGTFDRGTGLPIHWTLEERTRLRRVLSVAGPATEQDLDITLEVEGSLAPVEGR